MSDEFEVLQAQRITKALSTDGGQEILKWIQNRMATLMNRIASMDTDISIGEVKTDKTKKVNLTLINVNKDYEKHELSVWKMFLKKVEEWEKLAQGR